MDVGVIGVGAMGRNHARVYSELKNVDTLHLFDVNHAAAEELGKKFEAHVAGSMDELLDACDAVSLCVPTPYHYKTASEVIRHHVPVLIEKPICLTTEEATALVRSIPEDLVVGVGHIERFNAIIPELTRIVHHPCYVEISRHNPASSRVTGSTVVEDLMIHDIDLIFSLIPAKTWSVLSTGNADVAAALFTINDNPVYLSASRKASKKVRSIYIEEEDFTIEGDFMHQEIYIHRKPGKISFEDARYTQDSVMEKVLVNQVEPLKRELSTFLDCVKSGNKFPVSPEQGLFNLQVCETITRNFRKAA
ncbi:Gfo/Idh/MocA family protein [Methanoregula sp. UBA64]|jgi:predicted dehydrogenase|uniref:Gfo/Idh/MocA family protein n=1 Tax=Methanoregula sp. UBA64 TaxID=1915554 RepID=UPI0025EA5EAC|nr:Gfo/Idh/MocA family oxidoreductase [Methanoregula sp. UBA64]